jgi:hypothetical protein
MSVHDRTRLVGNILLRAIVLKLTLPNSKSLGKIFGGPGPTLKNKRKVLLRHQSIAFHANATSLSNDDGLVNRARNHW